MPFDPIVWVPQEVISSTKLNKMVENQVFLRDRKVAGALRNMTPEGNERTSMRYVKENLVIVAGYKEFKPGTNFPDTQSEGMKKVAPVFERSFNFPRNTFHPDYMPVVVATVGTKRGLKRIGYTLKRLSTSGFTVAIREFDKNLTFTSDMEYFISWMALGVKI